MNATDTDTRSPAQQRPPWTATRVFRTALAITLGVLAALVVAFTLFALVFGGSGRVVLEEAEADVTEIVLDAGQDATR
jgi:uncharacterized protein (DUF58 family)